MCLRLAGSFSTCTLSAAASLFLLSRSHRCHLVQGRLREPPRPLGSTLALHGACLSNTPILSSLPQPPSVAPHCPLNKIHPFRGPWALNDVMNFSSTKCLVSSPGSRSGGGLCLEPPPLPPPPAVSCSRSRRFSLPPPRPPQGFQSPQPALRITICCLSAPRRGTETLCGLDPASFTSLELSSQWGPLRVWRSMDVHHPLLTPKLPHPAVILGPLYHIPALAWIHFSEPLSAKTRSRRPPRCPMGSSRPLLPLSLMK